MKVRLSKDVQVSKRQTFLKGSIREVKFLDALWMIGLMSRPLRDDEWELVLEDTDLSTEFPSK